MKNVRLRMTFLLLLFLSTVLVPVRGLAQGEGRRAEAKPTQPANQTRPSSDPSPSPRAKLKPNEIWVPRVKVEPATVEFLIYRGFTSETKQIEITDEDQSNEWIFVRLKPWQRNLQFKIGSSLAASQTLDKGKTITTDQWIGFKNKIALDVTLGEQDAATPDRVALTLETGSAELSNDNRESATKAITASAIKPTGDRQFAVAWQLPVVAPPDDSDSLMKAMLWIGGIAAGLVVLVVLFKLYREWFWNLLSRWWPSSRSGEKGNGGEGETGRRKETTPQSARLKLSQLKSELEPMKKELAEISRLIAEKKEHVEAGQLSLDGRLTGLEGTLRSLASLRSDLSTPIEKVIEKADSGFGRVDRGFEELRDTIAKDAKNLLRKQEEFEGKQKEFEDARWEVINQRVEQQRRIERQLTELREQLERQTEPDVTYSHMLGELFGKSISVSGEDNFHELGEAVNDFFRHQVPVPDDNLLRLKQRGQAIGSSVEALLAKARQANGVVDSDLGKHVERVRQVVAELDAFYSQLTDRQLDLFVTNVRIPVAIHAGARDSFLDELGAALKREIEKLRQPAAYFERQFRQLATSEIVAITDICDKTINQSPGSNLDLEADLGALFEHAGLKSILPGPMEDFQSSSQDLVEVVAASEPGMNRKIARVISRGFSYEEDNRKDLLRKAAVVIYG